MIRSVYVPPIGVLEYCPQAGIYSAFNHVDGLGALSVSIRTDNHTLVENCSKQICKALLSLTDLDDQARTFMAEKNVIHSSFRLASIDFYVNGEFNLFYVNTDNPLDWSTVCFSANMQPIQIESDF